METLLRDEPTTETADPWASYAQWHSSGLQIRRQWMTMMGFSREEVEEHCAAGCEADVDEELEQYNAAFRIQELNQRSP